MTLDALAISANIMPDLWEDTLYKFNLYANSEGLTAELDSTDGSITGRCAIDFDTYTVDAEFTEEYGYGYKLSAMPAAVSYDNLAYSIMLSETGYYDNDYAVALIQLVDKNTLKAVVTYDGETVLDFSLSLREEYISFTHLTGTPITAAYLLEMLGISF